MRVKDPNDKMVQCFINGNRAALLTRTNPENDTFSVYVLHNRKGVWPDVAIKNKHSFYCAFPVLTDKQCTDHREIHADEMYKNIADVVGRGYTLVTEKDKEFATLAANRKGRKTATATPSATATATPSATATATPSATATATPSATATATPSATATATPSATATTTPSATATATPAIGVSGVDMFNSMLSTIAAAVRASVLSELQPLIDHAMQSQKPIIKQYTLPTGQVTQIDEITAPEFDTALKLLSISSNVYLLGPAGCGKSYMGQQLAKALGLQFHYMNCATNEFKFSGYNDANGVFHSTPFYEAFTKGGLFMIDEIDGSCAEVILNLNEALANGVFVFEGQTMQRHPNFRCVAAGNTNGRGADGQYVARSVIDASTLDRFTILPVDYNPLYEKSLCGEDTEMYEFILAMRKAVESRHVDLLVTTRSLQRLADNMRVNLPIEQAVSLAIAAGNKKEYLRPVAYALQDNTNNKYIDAFRKVYIA